MTDTPTEPGLYRNSLVIPSSGAVASLRISHLIAVGATPGPTTAIVAGQHGREVAGTLAAALAFNALDPNELSGTVHVLPSVNPLALHIRQQDFPTEASRYRKFLLDGTSNMDRLWGGGVPLDPILSAVTQYLWDDVLAHCDRILDLHNWSEFFCPMAWSSEEDSELLQQTGFPFLTVRPRSSALGLGTLREQAWKVNKPVVVAELPGQNTASPQALDLGRRTIHNFLIAAKNSTKPPQLPPQQIYIDYATTVSTLKLPRGGIWLSHHPTGVVVEENDVLGELLDTQTFDTVWQATAPHAGLLLFNGPPIWGEDHRENPMVFEGQVIARVHQIQKILSHDETRP